jgi:DHA1 family multidrug resistance protein-like MFS transporter
MIDKVSIAVTERKSGSWTLILALFSIAAFVETMFWGQLNAFTPLHLANLGVAPAQIWLWTGITSSVAVALGLPFLPLWGALADRYSRQPLIARSFAVYLVAAIITALAGNVWLFTLGRAVMCFALGNTGLMMTLLSERAPRNRVAFAFSILNAGGPIGAFIGPIIGGPLVDRAGLPGLLKIDSFLLIAVVLALQLGYRDHFVGDNRRSLWQMAAASLRTLWTAKVFPLLPALFLLFSGWMLANTFAPIGIATLYRGSEHGTAVGLVLGGGGLATLIIAPIMGALADRWGLWRIISIGAAVEIVLWLLPLLCHNLIAFALAWALVNGVASGVFSIAFTILAASSPIELRGRVMAFAYLPVNLGALVGAAVGTLVSRGSVFSIFPVTALLTAVGLGALALAHKRVTA